MKRKSLLVIFLIVVISIFIFPGCNERNYTKEEANAVYKSILNDYGDSFGYIDLEINLLNEEEEPKKDIFSLCFRHIIDCAEGVFFGGTQRQNKTLLTVISNFSQEEVNKVANNLNNLKSALDKWYATKVVFEDSRGKLLFQELVTCYNRVAESLFRLNEDFEASYFSRFGKDFSTTLGLTQNLVNDYLWWQVCRYSEIVYNYELKNMKFEGPFDESWWRGTNLKKFVNNVGRETGGNSRFIDKLKSVSDFNNRISEEERKTMQSLLSNMQKESSLFNKSFSLFMDCINDVNMQSCLKAINSGTFEAFLEGESNLNRGKFEIIDNFINGIFSSYVTGLERTFSIIGGEIIV